MGDTSPDLQFNLKVLQLTKSLFTKKIFGILPLMTWNVFIIGAGFPGVWWSKACWWWTRRQTCRDQRCWNRRLVLFSPCLYTIVQIILSQLKYREQDLLIIWRIRLVIGCDLIGFTCVLLTCLPCVFKPVSFPLSLLKPRLFVRVSFLCGSFWLTPVFLFQSLFLGISETWTTWE